MLLPVTSRWYPVAIQICRVADLAHTRLMFPIKLHEQVGTRLCVFPLKQWHDRTGSVISTVVARIMLPVKNNPSPPSDHITKQGPHELDTLLRILSNHPHHMRRHTHPPDIPQHPPPHRPHHLRHYHHHAYPPPPPPPHRLSWPWHFQPG